MIEVMEHNRLSELIKESIGKNGCIWMKLVGKSMLPILKSGTSIAVRKAEIKDIHIGDIVLFKKGDISIAHRVIKKVKSDGRIFLRAKSDISFSPEPLISDEELIGKVVAFKRLGAKISVDNFIFRLFGLTAGLFFPFIARARFRLKSARSYAVQS